MAIISSSFREGGQRSRYVRRRGQKAVSRLSQTLISRLTLPYRRLPYAKRLSDLTSAVSEKRKPQRNLNEKYDNERSRTPPPRQRHDQSCEYSKAPVCNHHLQYERLVQRLLAHIRVCHLIGSNGSTSSFQEGSRPRITAHQRPKTWRKRRRLLNTCRTFLPRTRRDQTRCSEIHLTHIATLTPLPGPTKNSIIKIHRHRLPFFALTPSPRTSSQIRPLRPCHRYYMKHPRQTHSIR
jgi:hypothetical protein